MIAFGTCYIYVSSLDRAQYRKSDYVSRNALLYMLGCRNAHDVASVQPLLIRPHICSPPACVPSDLMSGKLLQIKERD